jgi:uncharacterized repeat protein (TIGR01451 family)
VRIRAGDTDWGEAMKSAEKSAAARRPRARRLGSVVAAAVAGFTVLVLPSAAQALTYSQTVLADAPAGYWRFGEASGTSLTDSSGNANNGTYLNGVALGAPGALLPADTNTAATYDGVNDSGRVPHAASLNTASTFTLEGWVKRSTTSKSLELFNKGANGIQLTVMSAGSMNQVWLRKAGVTTIAHSTVPVLADNNYHHIVATMAGAGTAKIYIDGVLHSASDSAVQAIQNTTFPLTFGSVGAPAQYDEFALYNRALSADEVAEHYHAARPLTISKTGPPGAFPNQSFDYTINVTNTGTATAHNVTVLDTLPAAGSFVSSSPAGTPATPAPGSTYTISLGDLAAGASTPVTVRWKAPAIDATLVNSAVVQASDAPQAGPATATVPVGIATGCNPCGVVAAGTGLRNRDHGTITVTGIPAGATVSRAVLVWGILYSGSPPPNTITVAGHPVTADVTSTISGDLCWGDDATIGYAADVTAYVTGNGAIDITDPPRGTTAADDDPDGDLPFTDGASLIVFYSGGGANSQVLSDFSYDTDTDDDGAINRSFSGIHSVGGPASLILAGPDGQNDYGETFTLTGSATQTLTDLWDGSDPQDGPSFDIGNLWDTDRYIVSAILPAGQSTLSVSHTHQFDDCIGVGAAVVEVAQTA